MPSADNPIIHVSPLFRGLGTEAPCWKIMFQGKRCRGCRSGKCVLRIQSFVAISDIPRPSDREAARLLLESGEFQAVPLVTGKGIRTGEVYACADCAPAAERAAARGPSYVICTFDRLPRSEQPLVQVAR